MRFVFRQSPRDQWLLFQALVVVCVFRLGLWILPFRTLIRIIERKSDQADESKVSLSEIKKIASSVRRAAHYVPSATCLTQALATNFLLKRIGVSASLRIGVANGSKGQLEAHAWLESHGKIIVGKEKGLERYTVMSRLGELNR